MQVFAFGAALLWILLMQLIEHWSIVASLCRRAAPVVPADHSQAEEDVEVAKEREELVSASVDSRPVVIQGLRKVYAVASKKRCGKRHGHVAVADLYLGADTGECLGLLG